METLEKSLVERALAASKSRREAKDVALLEKFADQLNEEAMDVLEYQSIPGWE